MADEYIIQGETLTTIADAIRGKTGGTEPIATADMAEQIGGITTEPVLQEKTATKNGTVTADEGYDGLSSVTVNVPTETAVEVVEDYDGTVRDEEPTTLTSSDGYMIADSNGLTITMLGE